MDFYALQEKVEEINKPLEGAETPIVFCFEKKQENDGLLNFEENQNFGILPSLEDESLLEENEIKSHIFEESDAVHSYPFYEDTEREAEDLQEVGSTHISDVNNLNQDPDTASTSEGQHKRGRPRQDFNLTPEEISEKLREEILGEFLTIEEEYQEDLRMLGGRRKREDKPRTKIIRLVKRIPTILLKCVASVGDYKHKSIGRLEESYTKAYMGLIDILKYFNLESLLSVYQDAAANIPLLHFSAISFPKGKVKNLACHLNINDEYEIGKLLETREKTSVKFLLGLAEHNHMYGVLFKATYEMVKETLEDTEILGILEGLALHKLKA